MELEQSTPVDFCLIFQRISPEEGRGAQRPKRREYDNKNEVNCSNNVNSVNIYNT